LKKAIDAIFAGVKRRIMQERTLAKTRTARSLIKKIIDIALFLTVLLMILSQWGVNILPILTGASILGLAISFGAQTLIKDFISGFFILLEDQFNLGDRVKINNFEGEVYSLGLRVTILKDSKGNLIYIPNSQIATVVRLKKVRHTILP
jgi:small conductance mechanosensitive channel